MADITTKTENTSPGAADYLYAVKNPDTVPEDSKVRARNLGFHSGIYVRNNAAIQVLSAGTPAQIDAFGSDGPTVAGFATPDSANDKITMVADGSGKIGFSLSFKKSVGAAAIFEAVVRVNGVDVDAISAGRSIGTGTDVGNMSASFPASWSAGDDVELWIESDQAVTIVATHVSLWVSA